MKTETLIEDLTTDNNTREKAPLILIPGIIPGLAGMNPLSINLQIKDSSRPVYYLHSPYELLENKKPDSIQELAQQYVSAMLEIIELKKSPLFILCGYSFGGLVAHEIAKILEKMGYKVILIMLDTDLNKHFSLQNTETNEPLVKITNMVARLLKVKGHFNLAEENKNESFSNKVNRIFEKLEVACNEQYPDDLNKQKQLGATKGNLLLSYKHTPSKQVENLILYSAQKEMHDNKQLGWSKEYAKKINVKEIDDATHYTFLSNTFQLWDLTESLSSEITSIEITIVLKKLYFMIQEAKIALLKHTTEISKDLKTEKKDDLPQKIENYFSLILAPFKTCIKKMQGIDFEQEEVKKVNASKLDPLFIDDIKKIMKLIVKLAKRQLTIEKDKFSAIKELYKAQKDMRIYFKAISKEINEYTTVQNNEKKQHLTA